MLKEIIPNSSEERVYILLLASGQLSSAEIAKQLKMKTSEVESFIKELITKELVFTNQGIIPKYSAIYPLVSLANKAKNSIDSIQKIGNDINSFALERFDILDKIVTEQKSNLTKIVTQAKEENRVSSETATKEITSDIDKLIEEISQILSTESRAITDFANLTTVEINKHYQETTEKAGNTISLSIGEIIKNLDLSKEGINKSFLDSSVKVENAANVMNNTLQASIDLNYKEYTNNLTDTEIKIKKALEQYNAAAKDNIMLSRQTITSNYSSIISSVNTRLGVHDKQTEQILEERIRNISDTISEMSDEFAKLIKEKLMGVRREYQNMVDTLSRNVERLFTEVNTQLESLIATKTKTNQQSLENLFKLLRDNLEKNANETLEELKGKQNRISTELKATEDTSQRKMIEISDKLMMEINNNLNKSRTDFETSRTNISNISKRAKDDIISKYIEARDTAQSNISNEYKVAEDSVTSLGSKLLDDIRTLNTAVEVKSKNFIKTAQEKSTSAIAKIEMPSKTLLNRGKQAALKAIQNQNVIVNRTIDQTNTVVQDSIISETSNVKNQFKGYSEKFKESSKVIEKLLANIELTYRSIVTQVKDMPRPVFTTTTLIGKEAVLNQMDEILSRVKSTITLIYPNINDIPKAALLNSNPRTRIIVISDFDTFKNAALIRDLMTKENIQLKSLVTGSTSKPYYAIGRDAEEGLIGSVDDSGEVIGITSQSQAFVEMINAEIINGVITPKTKRVVLEENNH
ncbi:MAG: helix-turn-helix domain-containing protein [Candidatus Thorarchaeota archaeon]